MTVNIFLQFNGRVKVSPQPTTCSLCQHSILVAWLVPAVFHSSVDRWSRACSLQASASVGFHVAISLPQELWKATPRLVHIKLPHQPALAQFVWYLLKAEVGAQRWDLFSQACVRSAATDNPWFLYASWELDKCSVPHWFPVKQLKYSLHSRLTS